MKRLLMLIFSVLLFEFGMAQEAAQNEVGVKTDSLMVRMAEIEIYPEFLDEYLDILKEEAEASVRLEPGVICIYPIIQKRDSTQIRLLEIYAGRKAYEEHLETPHFKYYKTMTIPMVKSLDLVEMKIIDPESMGLIFQKVEDGE